MTFEQKPNPGIVKIIFKIDRIPHPEQKHLTSRLFPIGRVMEYEDDHITILTSKPTELVDQMADYLKKQNVKLMEYSEVKW